MKIPFTHYLHESRDIGWTLADKLDAEQGGMLTGDQKKEISYTFYEVTLECEYDTETGQITLVSAKL